MEATTEPLPAVFGCSSSTICRRSRGFFSSSSSSASASEEPLLSAGEQAAASDEPPPPPPSATDSKAPAEKSDDDKSWDISRDLSEFSRILLNEEDITHFRRLSEKTLQDFKSLQQKLNAHQKDVIASMIAIGEEALQIINQKQLDVKDFYRSMLPNHLGHRQNYFGVDCS